MATLKRYGVAALACLLMVATQAQVALRPGVVKPLEAAQAAVNRQDYASALEQVQAARRAGALTAPEAFMVERLAAVAALGARQWPQAVAALEATVDSPLLSPVDRLGVLESLVRAAQQSQDTARQLRWSRDYLAAGGSNASLRVAYLQTLFNAQRYDEVIRELKPWPLQGMDERSLQVLAASQLQRKDEPGYQASLTQLLVVAPSKERWADLLARVAATPGFDPRQEIFVMRLQQDTATLEDADDYLRYIDLALKAGLPAEAQTVLQQGFAEKLLGQGADAAHHAKVQALVARRLADDEKEWPALQQAALAAADATPWAQLAQVQASKGQWAAAATSFAKALAPGAGLRRPHEAQLFQGICLLKAGEKAQALQTLDRVSGDETAMQLARLWKIRTAAVR